MGSHQLTQNRSKHGRAMDLCLCLPGACLHELLHVLLVVCLCVCLVSSEPRWRLRALCSVTLLAGGMAAYARLHFVARRWRDRCFQPDLARSSTVAANSSRSRDSRPKPGSEVSGLARGDTKKALRKTCDCERRWTMTAGERTISGHQCQLDSIDRQAQLLSWQVSTSSTHGTLRHRPGSAHKDPHHRYLSHRFLFSGARPTFLRHRLSIRSGRASVFCSHDCRQRGRHDYASPSTLLRI